jgi:hypothetical protein
MPRPGPCREHPAAAPPLADHPRADHPAKTTPGDHPPLDPPPLDPPPMTMVSATMVLPTMAGGDHGLATVTMGTVTIRAANASDSQQRSDHGQQTTGMAPQSPGELPRLRWPSRLFSPRDKNSRLYDAKCLVDGSFTGRLVLSPSINGKIQDRFWGLASLQLTR